MISLMIAFLTGYALITFGLIFVGFYRSVQKESKTGKNIIDLKELVVIVPYRNEAHRIGGLISSLKESMELPKEIVFVDDHSSDATSEIIAHELTDIPMRILQLPDGKLGKKEALRYGIDQTDSKYILTLDADVNFAPDYFSNLSHLEEADLYVLPAILKADSWLQRLYEIDTILVNALNVAIAGWKRPIFASGANLLYKRERFREVDNYASHQHIASGDDTYLLRDFRNGSKDIRVVSGKDRGISTETPQSIKSFFDQRVRWAGKSSDVNDALANSLAILQFALSAFFIALLIAFFIQGYWTLFAGLFITKLCVDIIAYFPYFKRIGRQFTMLFLPLYEVLFPLYFLAMIFLIAFYSPKWKERSLKN